MHNPEIVIITGAGGGIGEGVARSFARAGWTVVVAEIDRQRGQAVADSLADLGGQGRFIETDVGDLASVRAMVERTLSEFGRVDVLVNNAYPTGSGATSVSGISDERLAGSMTEGDLPGGGDAGIQGADGGNAGDDGRDPEDDSHGLQWRPGTGYCAGGSVSRQRGLTLHDRQYPVCRRRWTYQWRALEALSQRSSRRRCHACRRIPALIG